MGWAKRRVRTSRHSGTLVAAMGAVGFRRAADRLDRARSGGEVVVVTIPRRPGSSRDHRLKMHRLGGTDQVARALHDHGWDGFEAPLPSVVAAIVGEHPGVMFDVGANTGLYSLVAVLSNPAARAVAFEPVPEIAALLRDNLVLNDVAARVDVDPRAVSDVGGTALLHLPPPQADGTIETSASLEPDFKEVVERAIPVDTTTLDAVADELGNPTASMIKIDVEGAEARVLRGASRLITEHRPIVSVEVLGRLDLEPLESVRRAADYLDLPLWPTAAEVRDAAITVEAGAPNHLLVPRERRTEIEALLREQVRLQVVSG